jgi:hypothetical protein
VKERGETGVRCLAALASEANSCNKANSESQRELSFCLFVTNEPRNLSRDSSSPLMTMSVGLSFRFCTRSSASFVVGRHEHRPGMQWIASSIRRRDTAVSYADFKLRTLLIVGSSTPAFTLSRTSPFMRSKPYRSSPFLGSPAGAFCAALWYERSFATSSVASFAAFTASCFGIDKSAAANSAMASCSRDP